MTKAAEKPPNPLTDEQRVLIARGLSPSPEGNWRALDFIRPLRTHVHSTSNRQRLDPQYPCVICSRSSRPVPYRTHV